jgi:type I restriction enzyme S subunit
MPPRGEMLVIGTLWAALRERTNQLSAESQTLESIARAIFKSWFVDFDPVRAKVEGREPEGMDAATADLFPDSFGGDELGQMPQGWLVESMGCLCARVSMGPFGSDIKTDNFCSGGVPVVRGKNLTRGFVDDDFVYISDQKADQLRNANAFSDDIVITHRGTLGQVGIIPVRSRFTRYVVSQSQMVLTASPDRATPHFLYHYLISREGQHQLLANTSQTGVPAISRPTTSVKAMKVILPPRVEVLQAFESITDGLMDRMNANTAMSRTLGEIRDTLMSRLISGKLRVPEAEKLVEAVL